MMKRILITLGSLLFLAALAVGQTTTPPSPPTAQQTELASIKAYAKSIDQYTKANHKKKRIFGNVAELEDKDDKWREFKTAKEIEGANVYESADVWLKDGKVVAAHCEFTSPSGDWSHYVDYYFRADGTLAKIHSQLNTFASAEGGMSVVREKFYSASAKLLHTATRFLDLKSQQPRKRSDFMDQPIPVYKKVRALPFAKQL